MIWSLAEGWGLRETGCVGGLPFAIGRAHKKVGILVAS